MYKQSIIYIVCGYAWIMHEHHLQPPLSSILTEIVKAPTSTTIHSIPIRIIYRKATKRKNTLNGQGSLGLGAGVRLQPLFNF